MSAPRSLNALQIAERLIGLGLCPVALRSPNDPSEQQKPAAKRGKTPFQKGWQFTNTAAITNVRFAFPSGWLGYVARSFMSDT